MEFGKWVLEVRKQRGWNVRTFGDKTGLESSTVNRIEKLRNHATLYSAFRICDSLDVSLYDIIHILDGRRLRLLLRDNLNESKSVVTLKDVEKVIDCFHQCRDKVINEMVSKMNELYRELNPGKRNCNSEKHSNDEETGLASDTSRSYSVGEVDRLLFSSPLVHQYQLRYPAPVKVDLITRIYDQGGALMIQDAEAFLKKIKSRRPFAISSSSLASIEKIKLLDILQADDEGKQEGRLIGVYWEACRFYSAFSPFGKFVVRPHATNQQLNPLNNFEASGQFVEHEEWELRLATLYLMICRWEQYIGKDVAPFGA